MSKFARVLLPTCNAFCLGCVRCGDARISGYLLHFILLDLKGEHVVFLIVHEKLHEVTNLYEMKFRLYLTVEAIRYQFNKHHYNESRTYQNRFTLY